MIALQAQQLQSEVTAIVPAVHNSFYYSIGDVLSNHWDPLDIFDSHWPHDKYESYVPDIYTRAVNASSSKELIRFLGELAFDELGVQKNLVNDQRAGILILAVRDYYFRNII